MLTKRIALGTAQFGLQYGIANRIGKLAKKEVFAILEFAHKEDINTLDTAYSYGESEEIIGEFTSQCGRGFNITSKMPKLDNEDASAVDRYCLETLKRLKQTKIYGYLIHSFDDLLTHRDLWDKLESLKKKGLVDKIGVSIYKIENLEYLLNNNVRFNILQVPYNIFDQRFERYFSVLRKSNVEIYTRSVFLQGLFFWEKNKINKNFPSAKNVIEKLHQISVNYKVPVHSLCLCFVLLHPFIDKIIIGVDSLDQLKQNINSIEYLNRVKDIYELLRSLKFHNEKVILPYKWNLMNML